ncbi:MAG: glycoside hydrolase family 130 protein [Acholeplasmataceae bacterium]|jgi:beta-1,4-mannooligosaccharide/beta-1,4-mannosyl-N-acetylglucosamine phosphorylase
MAKIIGQNLTYMPWENKPKEFTGPVWRYSNNPIIHRNPVEGVARIFNSAVVPYKGEYIGVFRAETTATLPHLRLGHSKDGIHWDIEDHPITFVDENNKPWQPYYGYDPRLIEIEGVYYIVWCTDFHGPTIGLAKTTDFKTFIRLENAFIPFNRNGVLFPRKIGGAYKMLSRASDNGHTPFGDIFVSSSLDLTHWGKHRHVMSRGGNGWWQGLKIGGGPAPIETDEGWLMIYHGVCNTCNGYVYSMGVAILDKDEPSIVRYRSGHYILTPEAPYEEVGFVPNVVFPCATLTDAKTGRIAIYYGAADSYVALAFTTVDELIDFAKKHHEKVGDDDSIGR